MIKKLLYLIKYIYPKVLISSFFHPPLCYDVRTHGARVMQFARQDVKGLRPISWFRFPTVLSINKFIFYLFPSWRKWSYSCIYVLRNSLTLPVQDVHSLAIVEDYSMKLNRNNDWLLTGLKYFPFAFPVSDVGLPLRHNTVRLLYLEFP